MALFVEFDGERQWKWKRHKSWFQRFCKQICDEISFSATSGRFLRDEHHTKDSNAGNHTKSLAADHDELKEKQSLIMDFKGTNKNFKFVIEHVAEKNLVKAFVTYLS